MFTGDHNTQYPLIQKVVVWLASEKALPVVGMECFLIPELEIWTGSMMPLLSKVRKINEIRES